jgi:hypothetical protein
MNKKGFERKWFKPNRGIVPEFSWRDRGKPRNISSRKSVVGDEIRTVQLPSTSLQSY